MLDLLWLLLPLAAASGWWVAKRECVEHRDSRAKSNQYFRGLNYLLDDKLDQAVEVISKIHEVNRETAEIHLALGNLFRRRGEVDRAIHIHHHLISEKKLTFQQRSRARRELGEDYMRAGLLDRAEVLFQELIEQPGNSSFALTRLIDIYQQEKDWQKAIYYCDYLERKKGVSKKVEAAHYCCELAEESMHRNNAAEAWDFLRQALARDLSCVRANILQGRLAMTEGDYPFAIAAFQSVERQGQCYLTEVIDALGQCYALLGRQGEWVDYLRRVQEREHSGYLTAALAELLVQWEGEEAALRFLEDELRNHPTFLGLRCFVDLRLAQSDAAVRVDLDVLYQISKYRLKDINRYQCGNCGFIAKSLHWCCPSCNSWNSIKLMPDRICANHS